MKFSIIYPIIFILFLLHLPFLTADPDKSIELNTRGTWTDEGLYASQARNFVNYGKIGLEENTTFIRGPLFDVIRIPWFFIFGPSLPLARLITLSGVILCLVLLAMGKDTRFFAVILVLLVFMQFRVFHFSHYALAEMLSVAAVIISFRFLNDYFIKGKKRFLFLSTLMIFVAWGLKIQFLYLIVLIPLVVIIYDGIGYLNKNTSKKKLVRDSVLAAGYSSIFAAGYILLWYLPNRGFYNRIMFEQTSRRFDAWHNLYAAVDFNFSKIVFDINNVSFYLAFVAAVVFVIFFMVKNQLHFRNLLLVIFGIVWLATESHKLGMNYLPQHYLLGFYVAQGFFVAAVFSEVFYRGLSYKLVIGFILAGAIFMNVWSYSNAISNRTWEIKTVNEYLLQYDWKGKTIAGGWAPAVSWGTGARTIPVWKEYTDVEYFFEHQKPRMVAEEPNEGTSEQFFRENDFNLAEMSDSVRYFSLWRYNLNLYWLDTWSETGD